ncbi:polysialic acid O-acetyltransferase [Lachnospiraceae bacterium]|nr:polysialic acid O-acetyltransferase [Lachnospiraceae bacterium]
MDYAIKHWEENTDFEELKKRIGEKKIVVWGAYIGGKHVRRILTEKGFSVKSYVDGHKSACEYDDLPIIRPNEKNEEDVYIFIAVIGVRKEIMRYLNEWNMKEGNDYTYISKMIPSVVVTECTGGYADHNGNRLECKDDQIRCRIEFKGFNSSIRIGRDFAALKGAKITVESGCEVVIGDSMRLCENVVVEVLTDGKLKIGNNCLCYKDSRISCKGKEISLGNYVTMGDRFFCSNSKSSVISIGNDCMFSHDVSVLAGGHSIFDIETKENVSMKRQRCVKIGNHVWLGKNAVILHNAEIGNGCIVGASSVAKIKTGDNCIIAGNPAKVIKTNHTWDRRSDIEFEDI